MSDPLDVVMVNGIDKFALRELEESPKRREAMWKRDYSSAEAYSKSVSANRQRFLTNIGRGRSASGEFDDRVSRDHRARLKSRLR